MAMATRKQRAWPSRCTTACAAVLATKMPTQKAEASAPTAKALAPSAVSVSARCVSTTNSAATNRKYTPGISHSAAGKRRAA